MIFFKNIKRINKTFFCRFDFFEVFQKNIIYYFQNNNLTFENVKFVIFAY